MKTKTSFLLPALLVGALASAAAFAQKKMDKELHVSQADITWTQPYGPKGPSFGFVQSSFGKLGAPASLFIKFPAGTDSGWHDHDGDYQGVVLKGTFAEQQKGEAHETLLPTGTYFTQPGKQAHRNGCTNDGDCFLYVHFPNGATNHPTTPDGKRLPPPAGAAAAR